MDDELYEFKFSNKMIHAAMQFVNIAEYELGGIGKEKVYSMLDAFDPDLKHDIIMKAMITGRSGGTVSIARDNTVSQVTGNGNKINAIKHIRAFSGLGLKEAKEITDRADAGETVSVDRYTSIVFDIDSIVKLERDLGATGYKVV